MSRDKRVLQGMFLWQTLKHALSKTFIRAANERKVSPWEILKGLENPKRVSRALDALLHDPPAEEPPP